MLKNHYILLIFLLPAARITAETGETVTYDSTGLQIHYYNEPLLKPGLELALDYEKAFLKKHRLGIVFPSASYFVLPENNQVINIEGKLGYRYFPGNHFSFETGVGTGIYLSQIIVPVYDMEGNLRQANWNTQLSLNAYISLSYLPGQNKNDSNWRPTGTLGWKGIFPNNLSLSHHIYLKAGIRYRLKRFAKEEKR